MAWNVENDTYVTMTEGDFGVALETIVEGITIGQNDSIKITFKSVMNGTPILEKTYTYADITNNTFGLIFTESESNKFHVGQYVYSMDWYQDDVFMQNIIPWASFKVVDKA